MVTPRPRRLRRPRLEPLEGRIALSHMGAAVEDGAHRNRGGHAEVHSLRHGADDPANHDATDDKGGAAAGSAASDDPASHDATDDKGGAGTGSATTDDTANHDAGHQPGGVGEAVHRHRGRNNAAAHGRGRHGANDPAGHH